MANELVVAAAKQLGARLLPDNELWTNRMEIRSSTSSRLYIVAQNKKTLQWGCDCFGWKRHRHCHHLDTMVPVLESALRPAPKAIRGR